jgi:hypothetical protein
MGTLLDLASLVTIPSGYKVGTVYSVVPTDGAGDLSFTRSNDTATRVGPNGLIEKVRTNVALQSQSFATLAVWSTVSGTITNNAGTAPDGTNTASKIVAGNSDPYVYQPLTLSGSVSVSCYVKGVGSSIGKTARILVGASLTDVTMSGAWQRISLSHNASGSELYGLEIPNPAVSGDEVLMWGFQVEYGDVVTDYIPTTTTAVSVGPVANLPRLDYLNSTCPNLLLEPQRTNLVTNSENLSGAGWSSQGSTITSNATTSPDGYSNADAIVETATTNEHNRITGGTLTATSHTASVFLKKFNQTWCALYLFNGTAGIRHWINLDTLTAGTSANIGAGITAPLTLTNYGNGWVRASMTWTPDATAWSFYIACARSNGGATNYAGDGTSGLYAWGAQIEAGAYGTSYIPTLGASSTRGVDVCSKTSATALIGQTAGTLYSEFVVNGFADFGTALCVNNNAVTESIWLTTFANGDIRAEVFSAVGGGVQASFIKSGNVVGQKYKIAIGYAANNFAFFVNGVQVGTTDTSGTVPVSMSRVDFDYTIPSVYVQSALSISEVILFPSRLSNAELAQLTTL